MANPSQDSANCWLGAVRFPALLVLAGLTVYANSLPGVFLFDDSGYIIDNPVIRQLWPLDRLVRSCPSRPLLVISLALNYAWGGLDVTGYHVFNIAVHLVAGLALYGVVRRTLRLPSVDLGCLESARKPLSVRGEGAAAAEMELGFFAPKGPRQISPGQRPGFAKQLGFIALKGHNKVATPDLCAALSGLAARLACLPRALAWAGMWLPRRGERNCAASRLARRASVSTYAIPVSPGGIPGPTADGLALTIALLWLVHPLQTQAVTYLVQRCEALMGMFFLLTFYTYLRGATSPRPWRWYGLACVTYCLGLASKEVMVTVLPVLWLYDRCFLAGSWREVWQRRGGLHAAFLIPLLLAASVFVPGIVGSPEASAGFGMQSVTPWAYARSQPGVILHYLRLCVWPQPLCLVYGWPIETRWLTGILLPSLAVSGLLGLSVGALWRGWRAGFLGLAFFLILAPTSSVLPLADLCFEHRMYLPLACVVAAAVLGGNEIVRRGGPRARRWAVMGMLLVAVAFGSLTVARNSVYHSAIGMWMDVFQTTGHRGTVNHLTRVLTSLGKAFLEAGRVQESADVLQQALQFRPDSAEAHSYLADALIRTGDLSGAREHGEAAMRLSPDVAWFHQQLAVVAVRQRCYGEAEQRLREAAHLAPRDPAIFTCLGQCLAEQNRMEEAARCFEQALELDPQCLPARRSLDRLPAQAGSSR